MSHKETQVEAVFLKAMEILSPQERAAYLDQACAGDDDLRRRVERMLTAQPQLGSFLESPPTAVGASAEQLHTIAPPLMPSLGFLTPSSQADSLGRLGHYEVLEVVGSGGMGVVLKAFDEQLQRVVAIKAMAPALAASGTARQRFVREAQAAAAVNHDNVVDIYAVDETGLVPYLVMEYIAGISLEDKLQQQGPLDLKEILRIGLQTADGLAAAHRQGLVHRDVKPANILLENGVGRVKITDFGLARAADDVSVTQTGVIAGTPAYMSPEQARGEAVDHCSDLFSLGSVLYALCAGRTPFRGSTSLGVLKQVCDEQPPPIRELNPDIPDWLCLVIERLHAKLPAERFQSATELAEVLGRYLAHVQQPSLPLPTAIVPVAATHKPHAPNAAHASRRAGRTWAIAAVAALIVIGVTLSLTDASGITHVAATVIRILTPDGTLVVETDDPAIRVTVEGDGGLVITGAGLEEIRLRPGSYKVQADRDGKRVPLERDVVSIAKGGREVVRVKLAAPPAPVVARTEKGAFVLLGGKGVAERKFDTLADAVQGASDGDTIEVRGNGPFVTEPVKISSALTIRAGDGFRPVINLTVPPGAETQLTHQVGLDTDAPLVLEGLEFRFLVQDQTAVSTVVMASTALRVANCRFETNNAACLHSDYDSPLSVWEIRNCEFLGSQNGWAMRRHGLASGHKLILENCVSTMALSVSGGAPEPKEPSLQLTRNTFRANHCIVEFVDATDRARDFNDANHTGNVLQVEASGNDFDSSRVFVFTQYPTGRVLSQGDAERYLAQVFAWRGERNLYPVDGQFVSLYVPENSIYEPANPVKSLADWREFWKTDEADSIEGRVRYQGGDLLSRVDKAPDRLTPDNFRLRPDSAGYRAGKDGKDLGADVDLVGPGAAYERWKAMPEYQQWLKETKQVTKAEAPQAESKAFVLLGGKGIEVRKFDTLAEAVLRFSDGDTIEVRGNGPFVIQPVSLGKKGLTIRAATGFRPVIKGNVDPTVERGSYLLSSQGPLVLEGLELHMTGPVHSTTVYSVLAPLHVANCRFVLSGSQALSGAAPGCTVRNCEFVAVADGFLIYLQLPNNGKMTLENNLFGNPFAHVLGLDWSRPDLNSVAIQLKHNTVATRRVAIAHGLSIVPASAELGAAPDRQPVQMHLSENLFDFIDPAERIFSLLTLPDWYRKDAKPLSANEVEGLLPRLMAWREERNLYCQGLSFQSIRRAKDPSKPELGFIDESLPAGQTLGDWQRLWNTGDSGSVQGVIRYEGGDVLARLQTTPELITAEDFRLRPDSAGYRAGNDGKDLGADIDLVGPGEAYESWKKTSEYQQWLKEAEQMK